MLRDGDHLNFEDLSINLLEKLHVFYKCKLKLQKMKKLYLLVFLSVSFMNIKSQNFIWAKKGGLWAYDYGYGITTDRSGNVYIAGKYEQNANFSGTVLGCQGNHDIFVAQYSPSGNLNWIRTAGGYTGDYALAIACDGNYLYVAGEIEGTNALIKFSGSPITLTCKGSNDIFLAKYTLGGNLLWARRAGSPNYEKALGVTFDRSGNIFISGIFTNSCTFGGTTTLTGYGDKDGFLAKYDGNGNFIWARKLGGSGRDEAKSIKCDAAGNVYICGMYKNSANFSGQIVTTPDNYWNTFLAKYSNNGSLLWVRTAGSSWDDVAWSLTIDNSGKIFITGEFNSSIKFGGRPTLSTSGGADVFVACYSSNGDAIWANKAGGNGNDRARGIGTDGNNIFITGQFSRNATFGSFTKNAVDNSDIFMAGLSNWGTFLWASAVGGNYDTYEDLGYESGIAICAEPSGNIYATGSTISGGTFGNTSLSGYSRTDVFITKIFAPPFKSNMLAESDTCQGLECEDLLVIGAEKNISESVFKIYPNPSTGVFGIEINSQYDKSIVMTVFNSFGQEMDKKTLSSDSKAILDLSGKENGMYFIDFLLENERVTKKIVLDN